MDVDESESQRYWKHLIEKYKAFVMNKDVRTQLGKLAERKKYDYVFETALIAFNMKDNYSMEDLRALEGLLESTKQIYINLIKEPDIRVELSSSDESPEISHSPPKHETVQWKMPRKIPVERVESVSYSRNNYPENFRPALSPNRRPKQNEGYRNNNNCGYSDGSNRNYENRNYSRIVQNRGNSNENSGNSNYGYEYGNRQNVQNMQRNSYNNNFMNQHKNQSYPTYGYQVLPQLPPFQPSFQSSSHFHGNQRHQNFSPNRHRNHYNIRPNITSPPRNISPPQVRYPSNSISQFNIGAGPSGFNRNAIHFREFGEIREIERQKEEERKQMMEAERAKQQRIEEQRQIRQEQISRYNKRVAEESLEGERPRKIKKKSVTWDKSLGVDDDKVQTDRCCSLQPKEASSVSNSQNDKKSSANVKNFRKPDAKKTTTKKTTAQKKRAQEDNISSSHNTARKASTPKPDAVKGQKSNNSIKNSDSNIEKYEFKKFKLGITRMKETEVNDLIESENKENANSSEIVKETPVKDVQEGCEKTSGNDDVYNIGASTSKEIPDIEIKAEPVSDDESQGASVVSCDEKHVTVKKEPVEEDDINDTKELKNNDDKTEHSSQSTVEINEVKQEMVDQESDFFPQSKTELSGIDENSNILDSTSEAIQAFLSASYDANVHKNLESDFNETTFNKLNENQMNNEEKCSTWLKDVIDPGNIKEEPVEDYENEEIIPYYPNVSST